MKLLVDNALSPMVAAGLCQSGFDAIHVRDLNMQGVTDEEIFDFAALNGRVLVSSDTDFGTILATRQASYPSVILLRRPSQRKPEAQIALLVDNLPELDVLRQGCVVAFDESRVRVRMLPIMGRG